MVRALETHKLPDGVECLDGGTGGFILLGPLQSADRIFLVDATDDGNPQGTVTRTTPRFSRDYTTHAYSARHRCEGVLDAFYIQGGEREVVLYAITIDPHQPYDGPVGAFTEGRGRGGSTPSGRTTGCTGLVASLIATSFWIAAGLCRPSQAVADLYPQYIGERRQLPVPRRREESMFRRSDCPVAQDERHTKTLIARSQVDDRLFHFQLQGPSGFRNKNSNAEC